MDNMLEIPQRTYIERPYLTEVPTVYSANQTLIDAVNRGESVSELLAFEQYFKTIEQEDFEYVQTIRHLVKIRERQFPNNSTINERTMQFIVPAYREGENIAEFLTAIKQQFDESDRSDWGVTVVMDYPIPYKRIHEFAALNEMISPMESFIRQNPQYVSRLDWIYYTRKKDSSVLPVGLARKVGEDVLMYEKLQMIQRNMVVENHKPLYLGLMDMDTCNLDYGVLDEMVRSAASTVEDIPKIIRVKGSYNYDEVRENLILHPLQVTWEGTTSQIGLRTKYNPFTVGRLSAVPARELALTGGGFARKLEFPDEDIRHGIQIAWRLNNVQTIETQGRYATSTRREVGTMKGILYLTRSRALEKVIQESQGRSAQWFQALFQNNSALEQILANKEELELLCRGETSESSEELTQLLYLLDRVPLDFDRELMECGALLRMYGNWANQTFRKEMGNVQLGHAANQADPLNNLEAFSHEVPPNATAVVTNGAYRFAVFAMLAIDKLSVNQDAPEIIEFRRKFLAGEMPHFAVEIETMNAIREIAKKDPERFDRLKPVLAEVDKDAKDAIRAMLDEYQIAYTLDETVPVYGILEDGNDDRASVAAPFQILPEQTAYMDAIREELAMK